MTLACLQVEVQEVVETLKRKMVSTSTSVCDEANNNPTNY